MNVEAYNQQRRFTFMLARTPGVGPRTFRKLYEKYGSIDKIIEAFNSSEFSLNLSRDTDLFAEEIDKCTELNVEWVCCWEDNYPLLLKEIPDPPIVIYYKGELSLASQPNLISIVGSRKMTKLGESLGQNLVKSLIANSYIPVSGMAFGVDALIHRQSLLAESPTIAVLPSSVDKPTPASNRNIYEQILKDGGLVISEYPPGTEVNVGMYAHRNRVIAGLANATIVVQAGQTSGALITARAAFDYGRSVYAFPGRPGDSDFAGNNLIIKSQIAQLIESAEDLLGEIKIEPVTSSTSLSTANLSEESRNLLEIIRTRNGLILDEIVPLVDTSAAYALSLLTSLEISGHIKLESDGQYFLV